MQAIINVPFHGETIITIETPDGVYVPAKPLCERFQLDWSAQFRRLNRDQRRWSIAMMAMETGAGARETCCIPLRKVAGWLASIELARVKPEAREALTLYQNEADEVLDRHFRLRERDRLEMLDEAQERAERFRLLLLAANPLWNKIARWQEAGVYLQNLPALLRRSEKDTDAIIQEMEDTGAIDREGWLDEQLRNRMFPGRRKKAEAGMTPVLPGLGIDEIVERA